jgi:CRISPR associated protein Cas1
VTLSGANNRRLIGLALAEGIPAKLAKCEIAMPLPEARGPGEISGYHCGMDWYLAGCGYVFRWTPRRHLQDNGYQIAPLQVTWKFSRQYSLAFTHQGGEVAPSDRAATTALTRRRPGRQLADVQRPGCRAHGGGRLGRARHRFTVEHVADRERTAAIVAEAYGFDGRICRPPRDPVNALLSLGYVLVGNEIQALLNAIGFDPYLGIFHQLDYGRPSLALDLLEELRAPLVDRWTTSLLNLGVLAPADFTGTAERGVFLTPPALKRYFAADEKELTTPMAFGGQTLTFRQIFRHQAERLARHLLDGEPYAGFRYPC